jgi:hypothetical protein
MRTSSHCRIQTGAANPTWKDHIHRFPEEPRSTVKCCTNSRKHQQHVHPIPIGPQRPKPPTTSNIFQKHSRHPPTQPPSYPSSPPQTKHTHTHHVRWSVLSHLCDINGRQQLTSLTAPPQPSKQELAAAEAQTMTDIKWTAASAVVLYFCKCRIIDAEFVS